MRKFICILNLVVAILAFFLSLLALVSLPSLGSVFLAVAFAFWVYLALLLSRSQQLWVWVSCLLITLVAVIVSFNQILLVFGRMWRADYGDRTIEIDPGSVGIPLFGSSLITIIALSLLVGLLTLPRWQSKKGADAS